MAKDGKKGFLGEFKQFISRGSVLDMAVGVIIATAFGKITTSLVNNVLMPFIGLIFGGVDLTERFDWVVKAPVLNEAGEVVDPGVVIGFGTFLSTIIDFVIVAFVVFCIIKAFNKAKQAAEKRKKVEEAKEAPAKPEPSAEEKLLTEIRDLLKNK